MVKNFEARSKIIDDCAKFDLNRSHLRPQVSVPLRAYVQPKLADTGAAVVGTPRYIDWSAP